MVFIRSDLDHRVGEPEITNILSEKRRLILILYIHIHILILNLLLEIQYFRVYIGDENYCRTIQFLANFDYGSAQLAVSNRYAFPNYALSRGAQPSSIYALDGFFSYGQALLNICPYSNIYYDRGTYAFSLLANNADTQLTVEVNLSPQTYPLPAPTSRVSCDTPEAKAECDVANAYYHNNHSCVCMEDSTSYYLYSSAVSSFIQL